MFCNPRPLCHLKSTCIAWGWRATGDPLTQRKKRSEKKRRKKTYKSIQLHIKIKTIADSGFWWRGPPHPLSTKTTVVVTIVHLQLGFLLSTRCLGFPEVQFASRKSSPCPWSWALVPWGYKGGLPWGTCYCVCLGSYLPSLSLQSSSQTVRLFTFVVFNGFYRNIIRWVSFVFSWFW